MEVTRHLFRTLRRTFGRGLCTQTAIGVTLAILLTFSGAFFVFFDHVQAAVTMSVDHRLTTLEPGVGANHTITFNPGLAQTASFITITFPSDFDLSNITEDDIDLSIAGVEVQTADLCGSEWTVDFFGQSIVLDNCGVPADGDQEFIIEIGTHASAHGLGTNRITNPTSVGSYFVNLEVTFGSGPRTGSIVIPITNDNTGNVGAVLQGTTDGGGGENPPPPTQQMVEITQPNSGLFTGGQTQVISWYTTNIFGAIDLLYSIDGGATFTTIATDEVNDGNYTWTVPNVSTVQGLVRVEAKEAGGSVVATDISNGFFTIVPVPVDEGIEITAPTGGATFEAGNPINITWTSAGDIDGVNIYRGFDGGAGTGPFTIIAQSEANDGSFTWTPSDALASFYIYIDGLDGVAVVASDSVGPFVVNASEEEEEEECEDAECEEEEGEEEGEEGEEGEEEQGEEGEGEGDGETGEGDGGGEGGETPGGEGGSGAVFAIENVRIFVAGGAIELTPRSGRYAFLPSTVADISVDIEGAARSGEVILGGTTYELLSQDADTYATTMVSGASDATMTVVMRFADGSTQTRTFNVGIAPFGRVTDVQNQAIEGAVATVFTTSAGRQQWPAGQFGQRNPRVTSADGAIGWYVPNGSYAVTAGKGGYEDTQASVNVSDNILAPTLRLALITEIPPQEDEPQGIAEEVVDRVEDAVAAVERALETVREIPEVRATAEIAKPVVVATAISSAAVLSTSFNFIPYLQYLFTAPVLIFARRRRRNFGNIYNAFTKVPIPLAAVRLINEDGRLISSTVSDVEGRYFLKADPGRYRIEVRKAGFSFPSAVVQGKVDGKFLDVYTGGLIEVTEDDITISASIPVDIMDATQQITPRALVWRRILRVAQNAVAFCGFLLALFVFIIQPSTFAGVMAALQGGFYVVTRILTRPKKRRGWGFVSDASKKAVPNAIVRLFDPKYNKLLETTLTDRRGRYSILAGPNKYYVTFEKPGYEKEIVSPVDFMHKKEPEAVAVDISLRSKK